MRRRPRGKVRQLIVPLVLGVAVIATAAAVTTSTACGPHDEPLPVDAAPDTPII